jgi:hypothetical protein
MSDSNKNVEAKKAPEFSSDQERLDYIKGFIMDEIANETIKLKVGDLLKILEIQKKLSEDTDAKDKFWEAIEKIRQEELKDS